MSKNVACSTRHLVFCHETGNAALEIARMTDECRMNGGIPDFYADDDNCVKGGCFWKQESSSGQCLAAASKSVLGKEENIYDDWVYVGKEAYGSRQAVRSTFIAKSYKIPKLGKGISVVYAFGNNFNRLFNREFRLCYMNGSGGI